MRGKPFQFINRHRLKSRLVLDGIAVGLVSGTLAILYRLMISGLSDIRYILYHSYDRVLLFVAVLLISGIAIAKLIKWQPLSSGSGIPQVQGELLGKLDMEPGKLIAAKFAGGGLANLVGLSLGREGPSIQIGAAAAKVIAKILRKDRTESRYMISAGASAGLSAAFNAPISGALFALEEIHKNFSALVLIPCLIASVIADFISKNMFGLEPAFSFRVASQIPLDKYYVVIAVGVFSGVMGVLFNKLILKTQDIFNKIDVKFEIKVVLVMFIAGIVGFSSYELLGGGHNLLEFIAKGKLATGFVLAMFLGKALFTSVSYGSRAQGGIFLPVLVLGGLAGSISFNMLNYFTYIPELYFAYFIILGMAAMLTSIARSPIIAILLVSEMTGSFEYVLGLCLVSITAYLTAEMLKSPPIYHSLLERVLKRQIKSDDESDEIVRYSEKELLEYRIPISGKLVDKQICDIDWPCELLIVSIERGTNHFIPNGSDRIRAGDLVTVFATSKNVFKIDEFFRED